MIIGKWFMMVVLLLGFMMVVAVPKDAMAEKGLGITKKAYLKAYNEQISRLLGVRFEQAGEPSKTDAMYRLSTANGKAILYLRNKPGDPNKLTEISIIVVHNEDRKSEKEFIVIMNTGIAYAVEPDPTTNTINLFTKKYQDKVDQGLNKFSYEMGDKLIEVNILKENQSKAISTKITPL